MGWNEATNASMPCQPDEVVVFIIDTNRIMTAMPYPRLDNEVKTADQNPIWLTELGMVLVEATGTCVLPTFKRASFVVFIDSS
jgi:hypothetical protein